LDRSWYCRKRYRILQFTKIDSSLLLYHLTFLMVLCFHLKLPDQELIKLDEEFCELLLDLCIDELFNVDETILHATLKTLFSVNLQYPTDSPILKVLKQKLQGPKLGNAIIALLNRSGTYSIE
jgi:hypothetical protein